MRSKHILIVLSVVAAMAAVAVVVSAGNPNTPPGPPEMTSSYRVEDIYNRLATGEAGTQITFTEPISGPTVGTGHTLDDIMSVAPTIDDTNGATPTQVLSGTTYWGLRDGAWGLQTGTMPIQTVDNSTTSQAAGYYNSFDLAAVEADLVAGNIVQGVDLFGVTGSTYNAAVPKTGQTISNTVGDDGDLEIGVDWITSTHFITGTTGVVTDTLTGLVWLEDANCFGRRNWATALNNANTLANGSCGLTDSSSAGDWRLPNMRELYSLIDFSQGSPALPDGHPFTGVQLGYYWSSTTNALATSFAWMVDLSDGGAGPSGKTYTRYMWPVRGGQ